MSRIVSNAFRHLESLPQTALGKAARKLKHKYRKVMKQTVSQAITISCLLASWSSWEPRLITVHLSRRRRQPAAKARSLRPRCRPTASLMTTILPEAAARASIETATNHPLRGRAPSHQAVALETTASPVPSSCATSSSSAMAVTWTRTRTAAWKSRTAESPWTSRCARIWRQAGSPARAAHLPAARSAVPMSPVSPASVTPSSLVVPARPARFLRSRSSPHPPRSEVVITRTDCRTS